MASAAARLLELFKRLLPHNPWKLLAVIFALLNLKSLPFVWHLRLLHGLYQSVRATKLRLASTPGPSTLFLPVITSSRSSPYECDYNLHKSNSTYFSDFDIGRLDLLMMTIGKGLQVTRQELAEEVSEEKGGLRVPLGGVAVNFRREIKPWQKFEVWTRILTWDRKWLYVVGHFVQPGSAKPRRWVLQPWRNRESKEQKENGAERTRKEDKKPVILASAISKYCFKRGRLTIPPERILRASQLLLPKPIGHDVPPVGSTPDVGGSWGDAVPGLPAIEETAETLTAENAGEILATSLTPKEEGDDAWDWQRVENERLRGLKVAELYSQLDKLNDEFRGHDDSILGRY